MTCTPQALVSAAICYTKLGKNDLTAAQIYLACQWANHLTPVFTWNPTSQIAEWRDVNGTHFTDWPTFRANAVMNTVWFIDLSGGVPGVTSVTNISLLTALTYLAVSNNPLVALDPTNATLQTLLASNCTLTGLDASGCPSLTNIDVSLCGATFTSLNVSGLTNLTSIICDTNGLVTLDCTNLTALTTLSCPSNPSLTTLTLTGCAGLTTLDCSQCDIIGTLNVSPCAALSNLKCFSNINLTALNFIGLSSLTYLDCGASDITGNLDLSSFLGLTLLSCNDNLNLTSINLTGCVVLTVIFCPGCGLNQAAVDNVLCTTDANGAINGTLDVSSNTAPSAAGLVCSANLDPGKGWTVTHD